MIRTASRGPRRAFTLVELMVSAAVCVLIMAILSTVFQIAIDGMRQVRSAGEMADQLRAVGVVVQRDLGKEGGTTFLPDESRLNNGQKLSDQLFEAGVPSPTAGGYMVISSGPSTSEGSDASGLTSTRTNTHLLQFTSILPGLLEKDNYTAVVGGQTFTSPAAEISYFLGSPSGPGTPTGTTTGPNPVPLFNLYRRQMLVAKTPADAIRFQAAFATPPMAADAPNVISTSPLGLAPYSLNTLTTLLNPAARLPLSVLGGARAGEDILLSNVISFEIKVNAWRVSAGIIAPTSRPFGTSGPPVAALDNNPLAFPTNSDFPYDTLAATTASPVFDTANLPAIGRYRVRSIQIRIRIYDPKLQSARQMTIIQDL